MTVWRTVVILAGALLVMLATVVLRAETTRVHYELSALESEAEALRQSLREEELCLARLKNPVLIRERVKSLRMPASWGEPVVVREGAR